MASPAAGRWFFALGGERMGPVELDPLVEKIVTGQLSSGILVWRHGLKDWAPAEEVPEIAAHLPPPLPLPPADVSRQPSAPAAAAKPETDPLGQVAPEAEPEPPARPVEQAAPAPTDTKPVAELRARLADPANWRVFPQLADALRKERRLAEALELVQAGLAEHPDYRLARITLAHVLMDSGELEPARRELVAVLDQAPENVVAGRLLGECLEQQGDSRAALLAFKAALSFAPHDPQLLARIRDLGGEPAPEDAGAAAPEEPEAAEAASAPPDDDDMRPIPLVPAEEEFELERPHDGVRIVKATTALRSALPPTPVAPAIPVGFDRDDPAYWPARSLSESDFPDLIQALHERRWTGTMQLGQLGVVKTIYVHAGRLVFATSSSRDDRLGELLLRRGRITMKQFDEASLAMGQGKRLGAILVEQGALEPAELVKVVVEHTREVIYGVFLWTDGFYRLKEGPTGQEAITLKMSTPDIILEGIRRIDAWSRVERGIGGLDARYERAAGWEAELGQMKLAPEERALVEDHQGVLGVREICARSKIVSDFEICRTLWALRVIGVLRALPPELPATP